MLYPTGAAIPPPVVDPGKAAKAAASEPIPGDELPSVVNRPAATRDVSEDLLIQVAESDGNALRKVVRRADAPKGRFFHTDGELSYTVKNARVLDTQDSAKPWAEAIMRKLNNRGVIPVSATL